MSHFEICTEIHIKPLTLQDPASNVYCFFLQASSNQICVFIISTYTDGLPPDSARWFCQWLDEASNDFRVQKSLLQGIQYTVFGLGNSLYEERFNLVSH